MGRIAEAALRRHRAVTLVGLAVLTALAWAWLLHGAGMPQQDMASMPGMAMPPSWDAAHLLLALSMWWVMMIAMMTPAAAPVVLLYARAASGRNATPVHSGTFVAGYLLTWLAFSVAAVGLQAALEQAGISDAMAMRLSSRTLAGGLLVAAGLYQLSPWKEACLSRCRNPADLLSRLYRPGTMGALRMGIAHGAYCVGCCWLLMLLLFVGGVMNLLWIAGLTLLVAAEKLLPHGRLIAIAAGLVAIGWGLYFLAV